jgi:hypothetical protein
MYLSCQNIQSICDLLLVPHFKQNVPLHLSSKKKLFSEINSYFDNPKIIFTYTDSFERCFQMLVYVLHFFKNDFILVVNESDYKIDNRYTNIFKLLPKLKYIYSTNVDITHPQIIPIPIGFGDPCHPHGNADVINYFTTNYNLFKKSNLVYFNFTICNNFTKRQDCYDKIIKKGITFQPNLQFEDYLKSLVTHKFCISPEGNGIDCYRFWESLFLRVIPICISNNVVNYFSKYYPVVNDWSELDLSKLDEIYQNADWSNLDKLNLDYMKNMFEIQSNEY